jgi:hypothetical protein
MVKIDFREKTFDLIVECMPFRSKEERLVWGFMFVQNLQKRGIYEITVPKKQSNTKLAKKMIQTKMSKEEILLTTNIAERTYYNLKTRVKDEKR